MINFRSKAKPRKKAKKKKADTPSRVARRPAGYFNDALTPEDIAEINLFSRVIAKMNARAR